MRKLLLCFLLLPCLRGFAQQKIVFEELRTGTAINYLKDEGLRRNFLSQLNNLLLTYQHLSLADTTQVNIVDLKSNSLKELTDTSKLHLFITVGEFYPANFFAVNNDPADSALRKTAKTVFRIIVQLARADRSLVYGDKLDVVVNHVRGPGMGFESNFVFINPRAFVEMMRTALNLLLNPSHDETQMVINVTPVYLVDDCVFPKLAGKTRTTVAGAKEIRVFEYNNERQLLRQGEPVYEEIFLRGKKGRKYGDTLTDIIKATPNYSNSDYVFLRQDWRDVSRDKNYQVALATQINPDNPVMNGDLMFTNFLPGDVQYLLGDKDTIARFSITRDVATDKWIRPGDIYNGYDTTTVMRINESSTLWKLRYHYLLRGDIHGHHFEIRCSGLGNKLKEIYLGDKLVCIAQGKFSPDSFVVFDATLPPALFDQLMIIAFNRFLE